MASSGARGDHARILRSGQSRSGDCVRVAGSTSVDAAEAEVGAWMLARPDIRWRLLIVVPLGGIVVSTNAQLENWLARPGGDRRRSRRPLRGLRACTTAAVGPPLVSLAATTGGTVMIRYRI